MRIPDEVNVEPLRDASGGVVGMTRASMNLTDRWLQERAGRELAGSRPKDEGVPR